MCARIEIVVDKYNLKLGNAYCVLFDTVFN